MLHNPAIYLLIIFFVFLLGSCESKNPYITNKSCEISKETFFKVTDILSNEDDLELMLDKFNLTLSDVHQYCQGNHDIDIKTKFISYVCKKAKNNMKEVKQGLWGSIRYNMKLFTNTISILKEKRHQTFMDIGSGNGEKLFAALCLGFKKSYGIEYSKNSKNISEDFLQEFINGGLIEIKLGDALKASREYYSKVDFIYMYSPIKDNFAMAKLFQIIMNNMKDNSILLEVRFVYFQELKTLTHLSFPQYGGWIAIKRIGTSFFYKTAISNHKWMKLIYI